ncbi:MAG: hypothetical protein NVSMB24_04840 [Mucilaginibacter sp.]
MKYLEFDTNGMSDDDVRLLIETNEMLSATFKTQFINHKEAKNFRLFNDAQVAGAVMIQSQLKRCFIVFAKTQPPLSNINWIDRERNYNAYKVYAFAFLNDDFGEIFIRRKTMIDRLINTFVPISLVFNHETNFNRRFYVIADDKEKANALIDEAFRKALMKLSDDNFSINISGRHLLAEYYHPLNPQKTLRLTEFSCAISVGK